MDKSDDDVEAEIWQSALDALLAKGATQAEAIEGANLILQAYRRKRAQEAARTEAPPSSKRPGSKPGGS